MITLQPTATIQGKAGTTSVINYTIHGDALASQVNTFEILAQGQFTGSIAAIYTASAVSALVKDIHLANTSGSNVSVNLYIVNSGSTATSVNQIFQATIPANGSATYGDDGWVIYDTNGFRQYVGNTGPTGTTGATGPTGSTGATGPTGPVATVTAADSSVTVAGTTNVTVAISSANQTKLANTSNTNSGDVTLAAVGSSPNADGASLSGQVLTLQPASATQPGLMSPSQFSKSQDHYYAFGDFGLVGDLRQTVDGSTTGGTNQISSATIAFVAGDVGKRITLTGAGASGAVYVGTISAQAGTSCTVSPNTSTTVSSKCVQVGTDNTTAAASMVTTINALTYPAAHVVFERSTTNRYGFTATMTFNKPIYFEGQGSAWSDDVNDSTKYGGTTLAWWGANSGSATFDGFIKIAAITGGTNTMVPSPRFEHIILDCRNGDQNQALFGIQLYSVVGFELDDGFIQDALAAGIDMNIIDGLGSTASTSRGSIRKWDFRQLESFNNLGVAPTTTPTTTTNTAALTTSGQSMTLAAANGLTAAGYIWVMTSEGWQVLVNYTGGGGTTTLTGCTVSSMDSAYTPTPVSGSGVVQAVPGNSPAIKIGGPTDANSNLFTMDMVEIANGTTWGPAGIDVGNGDSFAARQLVINGGSNVSLGAINRVTKPGVRLRGSNTNVALAARNIHFEDGSAGAGGVSSMGVLASGVMMAFPAGPNYWDLYQLANAEALPTVETGSAFFWNPNGSVRPFDSGPVGLGQSVTLSTTLQLVPGTLLTIPPQMQAGFTVKYEQVITKSAAGTVARVWTMKLGATGTNTDATIATVTNSTSTAAADTAWFDHMITFYTTGSTITGRYSQKFQNPLAATGFSTSGAGVGRVFDTTLTSTSTNVSGILYLTMWISTATAAEVLTWVQSNHRVLKSANP